MNDTQKIRMALTTSGVEYAGISWGGFELFGNRRSIDEFKRLQHRAAQTEYFQERLIEATSPKTAE